MRTRGPADGAAVALGAAQHALDAGQKLARIEGFGDVVVGAGLQADHAVDGIARGRHHDDADPAALFAQPAGDGEAVLAGQADIEQDQGRQLALDHAAQARPRFEAGDAETLAAEIVEQKLALGCFILDHDDMLTFVQSSPCPANLAHVAQVQMAVRA